MKNNKYDIGCFAVSKAGHDYNEIYVIIHSDSEYLYLADGNKKTIDKPKKKKKKHVQLVKCIDQDIQAKLNQDKLLINEDVKRAIKLYKISLDKVIFKFGHEVL